MYKTIQGKEFATKEDLVQHLIGEYMNVQREKYQVAQAEDAIISEIVGLSDGKGTLQGVTDSLKITPRENVTYAKSENGEPGLKHLAVEHPLLESADLVRVDYKEKGSRISKLLDRYCNQTGAKITDNERRLAEALLALRIVNQGKPQIAVKDIEP